LRWISVVDVPHPTGNGHTSGGATFTAYEKNGLRVDFTLMRSLDPATVQIKRNRPQFLFGGHERFSLHGFAAKGLCFGHDELALFY